MSGIRRVSHKAFDVLEVGSFLLREVLPFAEMNMFKFPCWP